MIRRHLALDWGEKRIGLAISDELGITAQRLPNLERRSEDKDLAYLKELINQYHIEALVLGLPRHMSGQMSQSGEEALAFSEKLKENSKLEVIPWDERLTTLYAERALIETGLSRKKRRKIIDGVSAQLILQSYLDSLR